MAVICEDEAQRKKFEEIRGELDDLKHVIGMDSEAGDISLDELRERASGHEESELGERQDKIVPSDPFIIIYTSGTTGPPKGVVLTHANAMSVCRVCEELEFITPDEVAYLYLPLAHVFGLTVPLASFDQGTTIVFTGGDTKQILQEIMETKPTYLPSVPRIFEKLYAAAMKMLEQAPEEEQQQAKDAVKLGVEVRNLRERGEEVPKEKEEAFRAGRREAVQARARPVRRPDPPGDHRRGPDRAGDPGVLLRRRGAGARGLGHDRDDGDRDGQPARPDQVRNRRQGGAGRRDQDRRRGRRDPDQGSEHLQGVLAERGGDQGQTWSTAGCTPATSASSTTRASSRSPAARRTSSSPRAARTSPRPTWRTTSSSAAFISQAVMYGDRKPYPVVLVTLDPEEIVPWAKDQGLPEDLAELAEHDKVQELVEKELERANSNYAQVEQARRSRSSTTTSRSIPAS